MALKYDSTIHECDNEIEVEHSWNHPIES